MTNTYFFFFSSRRRHTRWNCDWSSDVCSSDLTEPSGKLKDFQPWKDLLVTAKVLTSEEADILQKFYNYFSNVGTHRLGSQQEHVRVAKNTVIEWGLLLVGRVQALPQAK